MKDNIKKGELFGVRFKRLHGHTQIILKDKNTGVEELVADKDNLVTLAVPNIFDSNLGGTIPYMSLGPVRDMFGGVMCFGEQFETTALLPLAESVNPLIAHAGQTPHASASTKRGNPNGAGTHRTDTGEGYRFEWDFADNQGNGDINAVALCHRWGGDIALTPVAAEADEYLINQVTNQSVVLASGSNAQRPAPDDYLAACIVYDETRDEGYRVLEDGTVQKVRYNYKRDGLNYTVAEAVVTESHEVAGLDLCHFIFYGDNKIYGIKIKDNQHGFDLYEVSMSTWTATSTEYPGESSVTLLKPTINAVNSCYRLGTIAKSGNYLYLYAESRQAIYQVNLTTKAFTLLTSHCEESYFFIPVAGRFWGQISIAEGLVIGGDYIINGSDVYPSSQLPDVIVTGSGLANAGVGCRSFIPLKKSPAYLAWGFDRPNSTYNQTWYLGVAFPTVYLGTIQNLENTIEKRNNKTMKIIYTLTEVEENEQS
jgi:hypothetical protein